MAIGKAGAEPPGGLAGFLEPLSQMVRHTESKDASERLFPGRRRLPDTTDH